MTIRTVTPAKAKQLVDAGAALVDIREADEHARERIPGALHAPLSALEQAKFPPGQPVVFHCKSGGRTRANAERLSAAAGQDIAIVDGGLDAWKQEGFPVLSGRQSEGEVK